MRVRQAKEIMAKLLALKISNWESIPYSETLQCPNRDDGNFMDFNKTLIGWCDTPNGLMKVYECPVCHQKYRCHGVLRERWHLDKFLDNLERDLFIANRLKEKKLKKEK